MMRCPVRSNSTRSGSTTSGNRSRFVSTTTSETADLLRTTAKAVYCLIERGQLAGVTRLGRRVLVNREALLRSLARGTVSADEKTTSHAGE
jgi:excisionase family DNA binding protein